MNGIRVNCGGLVSNDTIITDNITYYGHWVKVLNHLIFKMKQLL